jgi:short-subunit dehydrogenase involved in D-alanine esterification of teichoic acids
MMNLEKSGCLKNNRVHIDIDEDKIPNLVEYVEKRHEKIEVSKVVNCDEIVKNEYNLIPDLYIEHIYEEEIVDLDALIKERKIIIESLQKQYTTVENLITQLKGDE